MGRDRTNASRDFFKYYQAEDRNVCNLCNTAMKGNHASNLERHLKRFHSDEFVSVQRKKMNLAKSEENSSGGESIEMHHVQTMLEESPDLGHRLKVNLNEETILKGCVELISVNGCSMDIFECSGFKRIMNPVIAAVGNNFSITSETVKTLIPMAASMIVSQITDALKSRMISLKVDIVITGEANESILALNAQIATEGKIDTFVLSMAEFQEKPTGVIIKSMIEKAMEKYNIAAQQIYSIVVDNGANMIKYAELLLCESENEHSHIDSFGDLMTCNENFTFSNLIGIECVAHTLQLVIKDSIEDSKLESFLSKVRELVKELHVPCLIQKFQENNIERPTLDCPTRWYTTYDMLLTLLQCKNFCLSLPDDSLKCNLSYDKWMELNLLVDALQPLTAATLKLQSEQLTVSDFFGIWIECKIKLQKLKNVFADVFYDRMLNRETLMLESETLLGAVYLDPRYQILLNSSQRAQAIQHLKNIWNKLQLLDNKEIVVGKEIIKVEPSAGNAASADNVDDLEMFLRNKELAVRTEESLASADVNIELILYKFDNIMRVERRKNILEYWEENKNMNPHLYQIAMIVLGAPASQVSFERLFSAAKCFFQENKCHKNDNILDDILIVKNHFHLL